MSDSQMIDSREEARGEASDWETSNSCVNLGLKGKPRHLAEVS